MMAALGTNDDKRSGRRCMNALCEEGPTTPASRNGWPLRSGDFANLCDKCGSAYEQSIFCDVFHSNDSGWRECSSCAKRLHCGCAASRFLIELLDCGGVSCISCSRNPGDNPVNADEKPNGFSMLGVDDINESQSAAGNQLDGDRKLIPLEHSAEEICTRNWLQLQNDKTNGFLRHMKLEDNLTSAGDIEHTSFTTFNQASKPEICKVPAAAKDIYESPTHTSLSITLGPSLGNLNPFPGIFDEREQSKPSSPLQQGTRSRHLLPKPPKSALTTGLEANGGMASQMRVARPPAEGRGRNQLLPRYWPRITDQELQQLSGDSNSTIVPLFEKVLSASDAGRIGRLVLPKACAEAYFPPISQPEGLPLRIQDVKGKDWVFQFRFWPNNNSRMYVLEGVTPCIQSMQLQAGDTVTFSRMDPEGKLVMGFRKASNSGTLQDTQAYAVSNGNLSSDRFFSGVFENLPIISGYSGLLQSLKGSADTHFSATSKSLHSTAADGSWHKIGRQEDMTKERLLPPSLLFPERKRTRNIGCKNKRLLFDSLDALELKLTWEEAQDLLRPPRSVTPSVVTVEDHDFEEYDEPPVFGKRSIFVARSIGGQEQWAQCDSCTKWRRLPVDVILPPKWTCQDNSWDQSRCSCSAPDELTPRELENLLRLYTDFKKRKLGITKQIQENESSGLDTLANAAILGDMGDPSGTAVATTTKHPRHRPGCSCIVCIQPPSGKGKHKPTCTCNVCMTVKRRFKTLMMRKKKRQSEREAEIAERNRLTWGPKDEIEVDSNSKLASSFPADPSENEVRPLNNELESRSPSNNLSNKLVDSSKGHIDLNCYPDREQDTTVGLTRTSMISLLQVASLPLDTYLKQNGLTSLASEQQATSTSHLRAQAGESEDQRNEYSQVQAGGSEGQRNESCQVPSTTAQEQESGGEENCETLPDHSENDPL